GLGFVLLILSLATSHQRSRGLSQIEPSQSSARPERLPSALMASRGPVETLGQSSSSGPVPDQERDKLTLENRLFIGSKIYRIVSTFFPHLSQEDFDSRYREYLSQIVKTQTRREFDLITMEFIATLHDGHTWFYDNWLDKNYGQAIGLNAYPIDGQ